jgi:hypothetical protein
MADIDFYCNSFATASGHTASVVPARQPINEKLAMANP